MNSTINRVKNKLNSSPSFNSSSKSNRTKSTNETVKKQILQLVDDQPVEIYCEVIGSRPAPVFSWFLGDQKLPSNHFTQWPPSNNRAPLTTNSLTTKSSSSSFNHNFNSVQTVNNKTATNVNNLNNLNNLNAFTTTSTALISNQHLAISTLHFRPTADADGKQLACRAENSLQNSLLSDHRLSSVESHVQLDVQCKCI